MHTDGIRTGIKVAVAGASAVVAIVVALVVYVGATYPRVVDPSGDTVTQPAVRVLVSDVLRVHGDATGRFVAVVRAQDPDKVDVIDSATGEVVDRFRVGGDDVLEVIDWDAAGFLAVEVDDSFSGLCESAVAFTPVDRRFHERPCPAQTAPRYAPGPQNRTSPDGALTARNVSDRQLQTVFGARIVISDTVLVDSSGRFLARFGYMTVVGFTPDGDLLVHDAPSRKPAADQYNLSVISAQGVRRWSVAS